MERFLRTQRVTTIIVSHDRYFLNEVCTKIIEIYRGTTRIYKGNYVSYLMKRDQNLATEWNRYQKYRDKIKELKKQLKKLQSRFILEQAAQKRVVLNELLNNPVPKPEVDLLQDFHFTASEMIKPKPEAPEDEDVDIDTFWDEEDDADGHDPTGADVSTLMPTSASTDEPPGDETDLLSSVQEPLLEVEDLHVSYGDNKVLEGLSLTIHQGEKVAIVGRNGCGKSTFVKAVCSDLEVAATVSGDITTTGSGVAYFPQRLAEFFNYEEQSVKDSLYMSCGVEEMQAAGGVDGVLERLRLNGATKHQPVCNLSGGEKARVAFAQFLLHPVGLLVLDEPTNHLDIPTRELLEDALTAFEGAAVVVSHDRFFLRQFATRVIDISGGQLRNYSSWDAYAAAAPPQWQVATEKELDFVKQDARVSILWSRKKMSRLKKKEQNVGLRRLSSRAHEFVEEEEQKHIERTTRGERREEQIIQQIIDQGADPLLVAEYAAGKRNRDE